MENVFANNCPECGIPVVIYNGVAYCGLTCELSRKPAEDFCETCTKLYKSACKSCVYADYKESEYGREKKLRV